jgi:hypothetical protein
MSGPALFPIWFPTAVGFVSGVMGYCVNLIGEARRDKRVDARELKAREAQRSAERDAFDLANLRRAAELIDSFMTAAVMLYMFRDQQATIRGIDDLEATPSDDPKMLAQARSDWQELDRVASQLLNADAREAVQKASTTVSSLSAFTGPRKDGNATWNAAQAAVGAAQDLVGAQIRRLYGEKATADPTTPVTKS